MISQLPNQSILTSVYFILLTNTKKRVIVCKNSFYSILKRIPGNRIIPITLTSFYELMLGPNNFRYKHLLQSDRHCIYGKDELETFKLILTILENCEKNIEYIYKEYIKTEYPLYLAILYQLLDGTPLLETVNSDNLHDFIKKNEGIVEKDVLEMCKRYYIST